MSEPLRWQPYRDGLEHGEKVMWRHRSPYKDGGHLYGRAVWDATEAPEGDDGPCWTDPDEGFVAVDFDEFVSYPEEPSP